MSDSDKPLPVPVESSRHAHGTALRRQPGRHLSLQGGSAVTAPGSYPGEAGSTPAPATIDTNSLLADLRLANLMYWTLYGQGNYGGNGRADGAGAGGDRHHGVLDVIKEG